MHIVFYVVRHGQTLFNQMGRIQGACDSPLTQEGINQALQARKALKDVPFTKAFSSTSERAYDTCELILKDHPVEITGTKLLKEFDYGLLDGSLFQEVAEELFYRKENREDFTDIGGDSKETIRQRIEKTFQYIVEQCVDGDVVLVVTHGSYGRHLLGALFDIEAVKRESDHILFPNAGIMKFEYIDGTYHLLVMPTKPDEFKE